MEDIQRVLSCMWKQENLPVEKTRVHKPKGQTFGSYTTRALAKLAEKKLLSSEEIITAAQNLINLWNSSDEPVCKQFEIEYRAPGFLNFIEKFRSPSDQTELTSLQWHFTTIAQFKSCYKQKFGCPRQGALAPSGLGYLDLQSPWLTGIENFSHVWILFVFNDGYNSDKPMIKPPKCLTRTGVFGSRSPHRPNPIGMTACRIYRLGKGPTKDTQRLWLSGHDLIDGTCIIDIKPYHPMDQVQNIQCPAWVKIGDFQNQQVIFDSQLITDPSSLRVPEWAVPVIWDPLVWVEVFAAGDRDTGGLLNQVRNNPYDKQSWGELLVLYESNCGIFELFDNISKFGSTVVEILRLDPRESISGGIRHISLDRFSSKQASRLITCYTVLVIFELAHQHVQVKSIFAGNFAL